MPRGCSKNHGQSVPASPTPNTGRNGGCLGDGWGGFPSFDTCIYIWKETHTERAQKPPPSSPAADDLYLHSCFYEGGERVCWVQAWEWGKKFLFLNPRVSFT